MNLSIDTLHNFLINPYDLDKQNFQKLLYFLGISSKIKRMTDRIVTDDSGEIDDLFTILIRIGFFSSKGEIIRLIKNSGLTINRTKANLNTKIDKSMFFSSGYTIDNSPLNFLIVRKGKSDCDLLLGIENAI